MATTLISHHSYFGTIVNSGTASAVDAAPPGSAQGAAGRAPKAAAGSDTIDGETSGTLSATIVGGGQALTGAAGNDNLEGDARAMGGNSTGGADTLYSRAGDDLVHADGRAKSDRARGGNDMLHGGDGDDIFRFVDEGDGTDSVGDFLLGSDRLDEQGLRPKVAGLDTAHDRRVAAGEVGITVIGNVLHLAFACHDRSQVSGSDLFIVGLTSHLSRADLIFA